MLCFGVSENKAAARRPLDLLLMRRRRPALAEASGALEGGVGRGGEGESIDGGRRERESMVRDEQVWNKVDRCG